MLLGPWKCKEPLQGQKLICFLAMCWQRWGPAWQKWAGTFFPPKAAMVLSLGLLWFRKHKSAISNMGQLLPTQTLVIAVADVETHECKWTWAEESKSIKMSYRVAKGVVKARFGSYDGLEYGQQHQSAQPSSSLTLLHNWRSAESSGALFCPKEVTASKQSNKTERENIHMKWDGYHPKNVHVLRVCKLLHP